MALILELPRIVQTAAEAESPASQVQYIVDAIQREMPVDVCSLYLRSDNGDMVLVASHGLSMGAAGGTRLPAGRGLVGRVAQMRHPLNLVEPASHPDYYHFPGIGEDRFHSFSAVPLVRAGESIGVLAVQCLQARLLSFEEQAFLVTLGAQLALVVANWADWQAADNAAPRIYKGLRGAPGIGIGRACLCEEQDLMAVIDTPGQDPEGDIAQWRELLRQVRADEIARSCTADRPEVRNYP